MLQKDSVAKVTEKGEEKEVKIAGRYEPFDLSDAKLKALIDSRAVLAYPDTLVKIGDDYAVYTDLEAITLEAMTELAGGTVELVTEEKDGVIQAKRGEPSVASIYNYGLTLNAKRTVRQKHEALAKGPEKTIKKTIEGLVALGWSQEEAEAAANAKLNK